MRSARFAFVAAYTIGAFALIACSSARSSTTRPSVAPESSAVATSVQNEDLTAGSALTPAQAADLVGRTVSASRPLLFPDAIPANWTAAVFSVDASEFALRFASPDGAKVVRLELIQANPSEPGDHTIGTGPVFHGDPRSGYQVQDSTNPRSFRWLLWHELGIYGDASKTSVPYYLDAQGLTDAEFWSIADSLHPIQR
jgi:hypothetical protein